MDGSADSGNIEDEVFLVVFCDPYSADGRVHVCNSFLTVRRPGRANAAGLFACLKAAMGFVGVANWETKLIGVGCDGANVNMGIYYRWSQRPAYRNNALGCSILVPAPQAGAGIERCSKADFLCACG